MLPALAYQNTKYCSYVEIRQGKDNNDDGRDFVGGSESDEFEIDERMQQVVANLMQKVENKWLYFARNLEEDKETLTDRLYFDKRMSKIYYPGRELSLDESMLLWHKRLVFCQYIKNKRHKYGIKLYMLITPTGCSLRFFVYIGMMHETGKKRHADKELLSGKLNVGHNFYNSYGLAKKLLDNRTYCTGTLLVDRKNSSKEVKDSKLRVRDTITKCANGIIIAKWKDKRDVLHLMRM
ncbi:hypothetical protein ILUMI_13665 [Ignelater luminosus]|uniref:PiggyBac transposable element-derived protein domain-containing protein n=1 Tax=Ignelater luminosus TaxID=2038154 RepID=A0A8K0CRW4_IGNLU|nr:hypothetical protein ILUMI_13665 [Ignelater luminosus]